LKNGVEERGMSMRISELHVSSILTTHFKQG
jgi:hypothetical protein